MARAAVDKIREIIKKQLSVPDDDIKPGARFVDDLGADSLAVVELTLEFEDTFNIEISDEDAERIRTVQDAIDHVSARLDRQGALGAQ